MTTKSKAKETAEDKKAPAEIAVRSARLSDDQLAAITSFADLGALGLPAVDITQFGTGFTIADKRTLVNVEFAIVEWAFHPGKFATEFVSLSIVTKDGRKLVVNDGGSGIARQFESLIKRLPQSDKPFVIHVPRGLSASEYTYVDADGKESPAVTYYLNF